MGRSRIALALCCLLMPFALWAGSPLSFEDRVKAQEAIERVYYNHRIWPKENPGSKPPFEQMVPRAVVEAKVTNYLKQSAALDQIWQRPITAEQLQSEMDRMANGTKDPATLRKLYAALGNDPFLIAECLARPVLADRLIRNWYAYDTRFHGELKKEADAIHKMLVPINFPYLDAKRFHAVEIELEGPSARQEQRSPDSMTTRLQSSDFEQAVSEYPEAGSISQVEETAGAYIIRWTDHKTENSLEGGVIVFDKTPFDQWFNEAASDFLAEISVTDGEYTLNSMAPPGPRGDPTSPDSWKALYYVAEPRYRHTTVWTGTEMIIWGGLGWGTLNTGGRFTPATNSWSPTSVGANCPPPHYYHTAVWTGTEMIIWGGIGYFNTGGRYNPSSDTWTATSTGTNCPIGRYLHTAVWTGTEMIIWGGYYSGEYHNTGGLYNPTSDTWTTTSTGTNCPLRGENHTAIWTGTEMIVWGWTTIGSNNTNTSGRYNPTSDTWQPISTGSNCPSYRDMHTAVWTGTEMIIWGGYGCSDPPSCNAVGYLRTGGRYNPSSDSWIATSVGTNCPSARGLQAAVWTGTQMIIWGGYMEDTSSHYYSTGGRYTPSSNAWTATSIGTNCPSARDYHTAVWTGTEMIIWGGYDGSNIFNTGGRYAPSSNSWAATSSGANCPSGRWDHTAVWTGTEMIIWGGSGYDITGFLITGGRYNPTLDTWTATSTGTNCPTARTGHTAIWTGSEMIVWGGNGLVAGDSAKFKTGGRYNPLLNSWVATSTGANCPSARDGHAAVWTGTEMIIWGGSESATRTNTGGRYNPSLDSWVATSTGANCPVARTGHAAVWTGTEMIIWGGYDASNGFNTGGRYTPSSNIWTTTSTGTNCPSVRSALAAVWTGTELIVWGGSGDTTGGRYNPTSNSWTATSTGANCPSVRSGDSAIWTGSEMIIWGGQDGGGIWLNTGGQYNPSTDLWTATSATENRPSARIRHSAVWTGSEMIIWDGNLGSMNGEIFYPNTAPRSLPTLSSSVGGDATFNFGWGENLALGGSTSTDGSNPYTTAPFHDKLDSLVSFEWDLNGDANFDTLCDTAADGVDRTGATPAAFTESDLSALGLSASGTYPIWLRVTDEQGMHACTSVMLTVVACIGQPSTPSIASIGDVSACAQNGIQVYYNAGFGATSHDLYRDGSLVVVGYNSGATYNPSDTSSHSYIVRAINGACFTESTPQIAADPNNAPSPTATGPSPACNAGTLSTQSYATYQWYRNGSSISGATNQNYSAPVPGSYTVRVTNASGCSATSPPFIIASNPSPVISGPTSGCTSVVLATTSFSSYQWQQDGFDIPGATQQSYTADSPGIFSVRVTNSAGCSTTSAGHTVSLVGAPEPTVSGLHSNACPSTFVNLATGTYASYQWAFNGSPIPGAIAQTYHALVSGNYTVIVTDVEGCQGASIDFPVFVDFCPASEVSPAGAIYPLRVIKDAASSTGYYIYFQRLDTLDGYNVYEGNLGTFYSHGAAPGNGCMAVASDLGSGEMRSELNPTAGAHYYLITAFAGSAEGPSGFDSIGISIPDAQSTCAP